MEKKLFVTTVIQPEQALVAAAKALALELKVSYLPRHKLSLAKLFKAAETDTCFVVGSHKLSLYLQGKEYFFHPNMAKLRVFRLKQGEGDHFLQACGLDLGMSFLDATMGLAGDSIVAAYATGQAGKVIGLETNELIATLVKQGLQSYIDVDQELNQAMRRVEVIQSDNLSYLQSLPDHSFDIVYFDPMFKHSVTTSVGIDLLRTVGHKEPLDQPTLAEATRVARHRVVIKGRSNGSDFDGLGLDEIVGGKYSSVAYGIIQVKVG